MKSFLILFWVTIFAIPGRSANQPVATTAEEYCDFLNTCPDAASNPIYSTAAPFISSRQLSRQLDGSAIPGLLPTFFPTLSINKNPKICIVSHNEYHFRYTLVPGRENNVININTLSSHIKNNFLTWRENPTIQELCDDINDQLAGEYGLPQSGAAAMIKENYPNVSKWIFNNIDPIAVAIHDGEDYLQKEVRDGSHVYITFSNETNGTFPAGLPIHAITAPGMSFYRPSAVIVDDVPPVPTPVIHVGTKSSYPLNSYPLNLSVHDPKKNAISIQEYVAYLNIMGTDDYSWQWLACYYDSNLMSPKSSEYCIVRSGANRHYSYAVKEGCENYVIDAVTSSFAQGDFSCWTSRPTVQELVDYVNDKGEDFYLRQVQEQNFSGTDEPTVFGEDADVIKNRYANSPNANDMFKIADNFLQEQMILSLAALPGCEYSRPSTDLDFLCSSKITQVRSKKANIENSITQPSSQP